MLKDELIFNTIPNANNRFYPIETLRSILTQIEALPAEKRLGYLLEHIEETEGKPEIGKIAFSYSNVRLIGAGNDASLIADIEILDTPVGEQMKMEELISEWHWVFRPSGKFMMPPDANMYQLLKVPIRIGPDYEFVAMTAIKSTVDSLLPPPTHEWKSIGITF